MISDLPPELWSKILQEACTVPGAFSPHPRSRKLLESDAREDSWRLLNHATKCRHTYRCISLVSRLWYTLSLPFFWYHLVLRSPATVQGAAAALLASYHSSHSAHGNPSLPHGGMGWFVKRIDVDIDVEPSMTLNEDLLRGLVTILTLSPGLEIYADHHHPGPSFDDHYVIYIPDGILKYLFRPGNKLRRVDWHAQNFIPFCSYLHYAPYLEALSLHSFDAKGTTWLAIDNSLSVSLPLLESLVLKEDPESRQPRILSTWDLPRLHTLKLIVSPVFEAEVFFRSHGGKIKTLSIHTPAGSTPYHSIGAYCALAPSLETLYFQLHHPPFTLITPLNTVKMIGIHGLLHFRGRHLDVEEEDQLHRHLTAMVRCRNRMPALKVIRLVDFDPASWGSQDRTAREVARWQRWQLRWEMLGVRWEDRSGQLMRVPDDLLELLEEQDDDDDSGFDDVEMLDGETESTDDYLSLSSASGMWD